MAIESVVMFCVRCDRADVRLDENGWCEECWLGLIAAYQVFEDLEGLVKQTLDTAVVSPAELQEAVRMSLAGSEGVMAGAGFRRESVDTPLDRGVWHLPSSAFDTDDECDTRRNRDRQD